MPGNLSGQSVAKGNLQRNFKRIPLGYFLSTAADSTSFTARFFFLNLSSNVKILVQVGLVNNNPNLAANQVQSGTLQITPITKGDGNDLDLWGNPVFSSPNFSGPLNLPNGWEFTSLTPKCAIDVTVNSSAFPGGTNGTIVADIIAEYVGAWWDPTAVAELLNRITIEAPVSPPTKVGTT
jgi:hypothetical protein